jgi:hypothetical protein
MDDQLEEFIKENRAAFDVASSRSAEARWEAIHEKVQKKKYGPVLWKVAAVLFLMSTSVLLVDRFLGDAGDEVISNRHQEFLQAEAFYTSMIQVKRSEIEAYSLDGLPEEFLAEVSHLDEMYARLKETFEQRMNDQQIMDAMTRNLQMRIEILNQQLKILETLKAIENEETHKL